MSQSVRGADIVATRSNAPAAAPCSRCPATTSCRSSTPRSTARSISCMCATRPPPCTWPMLGAADRRARHRDGHRRPGPRQRRRRAVHGARARNRRWCCCPATPRHGSSAAAASRKCARPTWRRRSPRRRGPRHPPRRSGAMSAKAIRIATSGRPGPVHLSLPSDLLDARIADSDVVWPEPARFAARPSHSSDPAADAVLAAIAAAQRPFMLAGPQLANRDRARSAGAPRGRDRVPTAIMESPRGIADATLGAFADADPPRRPDRAARQGARLHAEVRRAAGVRCRRAAGSSIDPEAALVERADAREGRARRCSAASPIRGRPARR